MGLKQAILNGTNAFLEKFLKNHDIITHTVSLIIAGTFAAGYIKAVYLAKDFPPLDWGWVVTLLGLAGVQHIPAITKEWKSNGNGDTNGAQDEESNKDEKKS